MISLYKGKTDVKSKDTLSMSDFLDGIQNGRWQDYAFDYRAGKISKDNIPRVTISGYFSYRNDASLIEHSGFICVDIDDHNIDMVKSKLSKDIYCYAAFVSKSGKGIAALFKINPSKHRESYLGLSEYLFNNYGFIADPAAKNESRTRDVSFDPDIYINAGAKKFTYYPKPKPKALTKLPTTIFVKSDFDDIIRDITTRNIDLCVNYQEWLDICFALSEQFGEGGRHYFHLISQIGEKYESRQCDAQFSNCLKHRGSGITIGTFYYYCKQAGIETMSQKTKMIASASSQAKKGGRTKEDTIRLLHDVENISALDSKDIVNQVFDNNIQISDTSESLVEQVEMWIRQNINIKRNEVTAKHEMDGHPMEDYDYNSIFLDCKKIFEKVDYSIFERILNSNRIAHYNPLKDWFYERRKMKPTGNIERLIQSIHTNMNRDYVDMVVKKWLCGIVDAVFDQAPPLMLVLLGTINEGKTFFFRNLLPKDLNEHYYGESKLDADKDDAILMTQKLIILDDEMSGKSKRESAKFKSITSKDIFSLRKPYGKGNVDLKRLAMLCATTNEFQIIEKISENRRILPIEVEGRDFALYDSINKEELLMEIFHARNEGLISSGMTKKDIKFLAENTKKYEISSAEKDGILTFFHSPGTYDRNSATFMTVSAIRAVIQSKYFDNLNNQKISSYMREIGYPLDVYNGVYGYYMYQRSEGAAKYTPEENPIHKGHENDNFLPF